MRKLKGELKMYNEKVIDYFTNPRNVGEIENPDAVGEVGSKECGDTMKVYMKIEDNVIADVKFKTFGCAAAIASSSMATEMIKGKTIEEALKITNKQVANALGGLPPAKLHCSTLAEEAIAAAIQNYYAKKGIKFEGKVCSGCCHSCGKSHEFEE
jgi:nitrogen fixation NifU-like protein